MESVSRRRKPEAMSGGTGCRGWAGTDWMSGRSPWARLAGTLPGTFWPKLLRTYLSGSSSAQTECPLSRSVPPRTCGDVLSPPAGMHAPASSSESFSKALLSD